MIVFITTVFHTLGKIDRVRLISIDYLRLDHHTSKKLKRLTRFRPNNRKLWSSRNHFWPKKWSGSGHGRTAADDLVTGMIFVMPLFSFLYLNLNGLLVIRQLDNTSLGGCARREISPCMALTRDANLFLYSFNGPFQMFFPDVAKFKIHATSEMMIINWITSGWGQRQVANPHHFGCACQSENQKGKRGNIQSSSPLRNKLHSKFFPFTI